MAALAARRQAANTSFDPAGTGLAATNVQAAIQEIISNGTGGGGTQGFRWISGGVDGIVAGTVSDVQAAANLAAMQAIVDAADAAGEGVMMAQQEIQIAGGPLIIRSSAGGLRWWAPTFARLTQRTSNVAVLQIGDTSDIVQNLQVDGVNLHYLNDQAGNTGAVACVIYNHWKTSIKNIQIANTITTARPYKGFWFAQNQTVFSCFMMNLFSFQAHNSAYHYANFGTGNVLLNCYLSGSGVAGTAQNCTNPLLMEMSGGNQFHESFVGQINIEWFISNKLARFNNWRGPSIASLHVEQCKLAGIGPSVISNSISNVQINGGCILDIIITNTDVTDAFPNIIRSSNAGRTQWNNFIWVSNLASYVTMPFYLHYQSDNEGYITQPGTVQFNMFQIIPDGSNNLRNNMLVDRTMGGTDMDGAAWGNLYLLGAAHIYSGDARTEVVKAQHRIDVTKTVYGSNHEDGVLTVPGNLTGGNITITLSNRRAPPNSRWQNLPVPPGKVISIHRGGPATNTVTFNNHDGSPISGGSIANGAGSTILNFYMNNAGNWVVA